MNTSQKRFDVVRDIAYLEGCMEVGETVVITIKKTHEDLYEWSSTMGEPQGDPPTASAMEGAFNRMRPPRGYRGEIFHPDREKK